MSRDAGRYGLRNGWRSSLLPLLLFIVAAAAPAQQPAEETSGRNFSGLFAGAAASSMWVGFADQDKSGRLAGRVDFGYRFRQICPSWLPVLCWQRVDALKPLRLSAGVTLVATDIRGMDPEHDDYAYANVDIGLRASYALPARTRLYFEARRGSRTSELLSPSGDQIWNYSGPGTTLGGGAEFPLAPSGRGLEVGVTYGRGRFTTYEYLKNELPADLRHRAVIVHVGWSGPFSGISLPWQ